MEGQQEAFDHFVVQCYYCKKVCLRVLAKVKAGRDIGSRQAGSDHSLILSLYGYSHNQL
jgi:hypothetical protein